MLRYCLIVLAALTLLPQPASRAADDLGPVAPFVNDSTLALTRIDLARADLKDYDHPAVPVEQVRKRLLDAGAKQAFIVSSSGAVQDGPGMVIVPIDAGADEQKIITALAEPFAAAPTPRRERGRRQPHEYVVQRVRDAVVLARLGEIQQLKSMTATSRPDLVEAIKAAGDAPVAGGVAIAPTAAAMLQQAVPNLPPQMGALSTADLLAAFRFASYGGDLVKSGFTLKVQATSADAAQKLLPLVQNILNSMMKNPIAAEQKQQPRPQPNVESETIVVTLSPQQIKDVYNAHLAATLWVQSARHVRMMSQAIYLFFDAKRSWPPDLDTLVKDGYLDPSVLINPRHPDKKPGYIYVKPEGKMGDIPAENINLYENLDGDFSNGIVVGFQDGHAEVLSAKEKPRFEQELKKTEAENKARAAKAPAAR